MLDDLAGLDSVPALIARNARIKAAIVAEEEFEKLGVRALLNFGHTVGHAIEKAAGYGRYLPAKPSASASPLRFICPSNRRACPGRPTRFGTLRDFDLPVRLPKDIETGALMEALFKDKKFESGAILFVLTARLGSALSEEGDGRDMRRLL